MEAIPNQDLVDQVDPDDAVGATSSLNSSTFGCPGDCITGRPNVIPERGNFVGLRPSESELRAVGRFGLRANGVEMLQFVIGGLQGELGFTSLLNNNELNFEVSSGLDNSACMDTLIPDPEVHLSAPFSARNFLRMTAPPEFGNTLLALLKSDDPSEPQPAESTSGKVQRGAMLFGIDLTAFANRMVPGRMPETGDDGLDPQAINQSDRMVGCVGCHTPVQRTGLSPAVGRDFQVVTRHVSFVWRRFLQTSSSTPGLSSMRSGLQQRRGIRCLSAELTTRVCLTRLIYPGISRMTRSRTSKVRPSVRIFARHL
jgi:hypothetical protein